MTADAIIIASLSLAVYIEKVRVVERGGEEEGKGLTKNNKLMIEMVFLCQKREEFDKK